MLLQVQKVHFSSLYVSLMIGKFHTKITKFPKKDRKYSLTLYEMYILVVYLLVILANLDFSCA